MSESLFQRPSDDGPKVSEVVGQSVPMFKDCPYLHDAMSSKVNGKAVIKGCTIRIGFYLSEVQICVTDEHYHKYAYAVLDPFKPLHEAIEEVLSSGPLNWQQSRGKR